MDRRSFGRDRIEAGIDHVRSLGLDAPHMGTNTGGRTMDAARKAQSLSAGTAPVVTARPDRHNDLSRQIAALNELTAPQLRDEWRRLHRGQPPRLSRDLLIRTLAYRMQELAYGGLSKATQRRLAVLTKELRDQGSVVITPDLSLRPGTRLVREWRGRTHTVVVTEDGFKYADKAFPSLTKIAHAITGAHWSGPRFFGLTGKRALNGRSAPEGAGATKAQELADG